jgi:hypothetical protein
MAKKLVFVLLMIVVFSAAAAYAGTVQLPKTGQTTCYDAAGAVVACTGTGQDADKGKGVAWPSPRFTDNGNGTVTDGLTGLVWLKNANCFSTQTWTQAVADANGLANGSCSLTDGSTAGQWRLPNVDELESLVNGGQSNTATWLNTQGFSSVQSDGYWSGTTFAVRTSDAGGVGMYDGSVSFYYKTDAFYVWPVR